MREQTIRTRHKLVGKLPITGELLRGTLLERTIRHSKGCPKCERGEGHRVFVLNQIITDYEVCARRPYDTDLLVAAIETHQALLGRAPHLVAAGTAFYSAKNEPVYSAKNEAVAKAKCTAARF
jgi:hypothetical protein